MTQATDFKQCASCTSYFDPTKLRGVDMIFDFEENGGVKKVTFYFCSDSECAWTRKYFAVQAAFTILEPMTRSRVWELSRIARGEDQGEQDDST